MPLSGVPIILKTKHSIKDRLYWNFLNFIPFLTGLIGIARDSILWVFAYICIYFFFLIIQLRFSCTYCTYYTQSKGCVKCMMFPGVIQVFKGRQGSPGLFEKVTAALGALALFLFPVYWLIRDPLLLVTYVLAWGLFSFTTLV